MTTVLQGNGSVALCALDTLLKSAFLSGVKKGNVLNKLD